VQWFDAATPPLQKHLPLLTEHVKRLLSIDGSSVPATTDVPPERKAEPTSFAPTTRWIIAFGLLALAAVIAAAWLFFSANRSTQPTASFSDTQETVSNSSVAEIPTKSIAVLPFESLSANKDDTYFADGVQDEILNNLVSRTPFLEMLAVTPWRPMLAEMPRLLAFSQKPEARNDLDAFTEAEAMASKRRSP
jgi:hypothetical protein